jgi:hypothetical protein
MIIISMLNNYLIGLPKEQEFLEFLTLNITLKIKMIMNKYLQLLHIFILKLILKNLIMFKIHGDHILLMILLYNL